MSKAKEEPTVETDEKKKPTPEEMEKRREELLAFYKEQIPFLNQQLEYEKLLTSIEEERGKRILSQMRVAQLLAPEPPEMPPSEGSESREEAPGQTVHRTLKKD